jgi:hypothetical protein
MIRRERTNELLVALFLLGVVLLLPPVLLVFNRPERIMGVPVLYLYLFAAWAVLIGLVAAIARRIGAQPEMIESPGAEPPAAAEDARDA